MQEDSKKAFFEVCDKIKAVHPEQEKTLCTMCHDAMYSPYYPIAPNMVSLVAQYRDCFSDDDYIHYMRILAMTVHNAIGVMLAYGQG